MNKIAISVTIFTLFLSSLHGNPEHSDGNASMQKVMYAQSVFKRKLQKKCNFTAAYFAQQRTQKEWASLYHENAFKKEFDQICPRGKDILKDAWIEPLYLFSIQYAKDSLVRPQC